MNLTKRTTKAEFRRLLEVCDDANYSHKLWVGHDGEVHFSRIPIGSNIGSHFDAKKDGAKFHFETFPYKGNYTGLDAVKDDAWVARVYTALEKNWKEGATDYIEVF